MDQTGPAGDTDVPAGTDDGGTVPASSLAVSDGEHTPGDEPAVRRPATPWQSLAARWRRSPVTRHLAILAGFLLAGIAFTWPRATYLWHHRLPSTRDAASFVWGLWWVAHQVAHLSNPWFTRYLAAPVGAQLGFHTLLPLPGLAMTPITLAFGPTVSYNLLSALTPGLLAYAMYRVGRLWLPSQTGAIAAGAFYGLSSMLTNNSWYELNLAMGALFIPLALEGAVRLRRRPGWRQAVILGVILGAALLTDQESAILATFAAALALLPWLVSGPFRGKRAAGTGSGSTPAAEPAPGRRRGMLLGRLWPVSLAAVATLVVASPQIIAMIAQAADGNASFPPLQLAASYDQYGAGLLGLFAPSPRMWTYGFDGASSFFYHSGIVNPNHLIGELQVSDVPMFGVVLTILAIAGLIVSLRRRNAWLLALLAVGCAALALGPQLWIGPHVYTPVAQTWQGIRVSLLMPYTWLVRLPGFSNFREAWRFAELALAGMALLAAAAIDWLRYHAKPVLAVAVALSLFELGWAGNPPGNVMPVQLKISSMPASMPKLDRRIAADHSPSIVVDFPFGIRGGPPIYGPGFNPETEVLATADGHPLADGLISRVPSSTLNGIQSHAFYVGLNYVIHQSKHTAGYYLGRNGVYYTYPPSSKKYLTKVEWLALEAAAKQDARRMNVGWVIVWPQQQVPHSIAHFLTATGFKLDYRVYVPNLLPKYKVHYIEVYHR
jgi:hypothetical protein